MADTRILKLVLVGSAVLLRSVTAEAFCVSTPQPLIVDPNFKPIFLQFDVHVTRKWDGVGNSTAVDQSFSQGVTIDRSFQQTSDICSNNISIVANPGSTATANTTDISSHVGRDFSILLAHATLKSQDTGYVTETTPCCTISSSTYALSFRISAADYLPILSDDLVHYNYADYAREISLDESGLRGYYAQTLDLASYLQSRIGTSGDYKDLVAMTDENYQSVDKFGFEGTATLTAVQVAVPEPGTLELGLVGLAMLSCVARRAASNRGGRPERRRG